MSILYDFGDHDNGGRDDDFGELGNYDDGDDDSI